MSPNTQLSHPEIAPANDRGEVEGTHLSEAARIHLERKNDPKREAEAQRVEAMLRESFEAHARFLAQGGELLATMASLVARSYRNGGKTLFLGNGGSAADAQHAAAELVGRFNFNRAPLPALSLATDTSVLTCVANDWDYSEIFSRQVRALARPGDVVIGLSTSGRSENVAKALKAGRELGAISLAFTGAQGRNVGREADLVLAVPTASTPRIQELHILALHSLCDLVEAELFGSAAHPES